MWESFTRTDVLAILATLVAAFAGAWAAFLFESVRRSYEEIAKNCAAANRALYTIFNMWNIMVQFEQDIVEPAENLPAPWLNMPTTIPYQYGLTTFDAVGLAFLLDGESADLYARIMMEEQRFAGTVRLIEARTHLMLENVHPGMGAAGVRVGSRITEEQAERIIGLDVSHRLQSMVPEISKQVRSNIASLITAHDDLRAEMKVRHPKRKFVRVLPKNNEEGTKNAA